MAIVIVDCDTGLLVAANGYTNDLAAALQFGSKDEAEQFCAQHSYHAHKIIELDHSKRFGRSLEYCGKAV